MTINEKSKLIFAENFIGSIATINEDGSPWSTPLHMVADDDYVYWFSTEDKVHSRNIARDPRVSLSLFCPDLSRGLQGVYVNGKAELLRGEAREEAWQVFSAKLGENTPKSLTGASGYRLPIGDVDYKKSTGNCWYFYSQKD